MTETAEQPLKLRAEDADDLAVVSACLQDSLVPLCEIAYLKDERRFVLIANRFRWECGCDDEALEAEESEAPEFNGAAEGEDDDARFAESAPQIPYERVNCGLCFDGVTAVRSRGLDTSRRDVILNLLAIEPEEHAVTFYFSGGGVIRVEVERISCRVEDLCEPWPTRWRPRHKLDDETTRRGN